MMLGGNHERDAPITLCIFPNQREFLAIDTRDERQQSIHVFTVDELLGGDFVDRVESSLRDLIDSPGIGFTDLMAVPQQVELAMRVHALKRVLELLGADDDPTVDDEGGAVGVMFFSGPMLSIGETKLAITLREMLGEKLDDDELIRLRDKILRLMEAERKAEKSLSDKSIEGLIRGDDGPFVTIWQQKSGD